MNGKKILSILFISLLIFGCKQNSKQAVSNEVKADRVFTIDDKQWQITVNNGKGTPNSVYAVAPSMGLLDNYLQNISMIDRELARTLSNNKTNLTSFVE